MTIRLFAINPSFDFYLLFCGSREPRESIKLHTFPSQILDHATIYVCVYMISYYTRTHIYIHISVLRPHAIFPFWRWVLFKYPYSIVCL